MTLLQTLNKKLAYALDHGWQPMPGYRVLNFKVTVNKSGFGHVGFQLTHERGDETVLSQVTWSINDVLFDHGFAKAVWDDTKWWIALPGKSGEKRQEVEIPAWKMHLQQIINLESNKGRINYLGSTT